MIWMFVSSSKFYVEPLTPKVMVLVDEAFGRYLGYQMRWWGNEDGVFVMQLVPL